jgi:glycosyltransferase involved in cell wall biosynthesis
MSASPPHTSLHVAYELSPREERFVQLDRYATAEWLGFSAIAENAMERRIQRPKLSRYRAAWQVVMSTRGRDRPAIVSHMPTLTVAVEGFRKLLGCTAPHIAFSFNYTELPTGRRLALQRRALQSVDRFVVFSNHERQLYSQHFGIPLERFVFTPWTQSPPPLAEPVERPFAEPYLCAIGGEGRDYPLLIEATKARQTRLVIVGRPHSLEGVHVPPHVRFMSNLPLATTWALARQSAGMVLPLKTSTTCCGQITVMSAMMLGIPLLCADSVALRDYVSDDDANLLYRPGSLQDLTDKLALFEQRAPLMQEAACRRRDVVCDQWRRSVWTNTLELILDELP